MLLSFVFCFSEAGGQRLVCGLGSLALMWLDSGGAPPSSLRSSLPLFSPLSSEPLWWQEMAGPASVSQ